MTLPSPEPVLNSDGITTDADNDTIEFKTNQKTSWVALDDIKMIIPLEDD